MTGWFKKPPLCTVVYKFFTGFFLQFFLTFFTKPGLAMETPGDFSAGYLGGLKLRKGRGNGKG